jgi:hypothetical protein
MKKVNTRAMLRFITPERIIYTIFKFSQIIKFNSGGWRCNRVTEIFSNIVDMVVDVTPVDAAEPLDVGNVEASWSIMAG